jgi:uncharacterized protein with PQ loop repeat
MSVMTITSIVGFITIGLGILVKVIGFPDQIRKNYRNKSTKGISTTFFILSFCAYLFWTLHGILLHDMVVVIGQGLGIITTGAILWQIYFYRNTE